VPRAWHAPDFTEGVDPVSSIRLARGDIALGFFTTVTAFSWPRVVTLDELRIESSFPLDAATRRFCEANA
jgi:hypothetical protein